MAKSQIKNRQILEAAASEFDEHGFDGANIDRIAARAQVSKRTVYNHFTSKEQLFDALVAHAIGFVTEALAIGYAPDAPLRPQLTRLAEAHGALLRSPEFMRFARIGTTLIMRKPELAETLTLKSPHETYYLDFFKAAAAAGTIRADAPETAAAQFLAMLKAEAYWPALFSGQLIAEPALARVIETSVDTIMRAFGTQAA
jgi:TetR/AcrR family transcriptional regulator of autoinduction and epiphytic fitness